MNAEGNVEMTVSVILERISFLLLAVVVFVRPLVPESYDTGPSVFGTALGTVTDPSPLASLGFDLIILIGAAGWLVARILGRREPFPKTGLSAGTVVVALAATVSCLACGNKRVAVNASIDWICGPILAMALVGLMQTRWRTRLLIAGILASAGVQAVQCFDQHFLGFDDTWQQYQSMKNELWAAQGVPLDSPRVRLFEGRMRARESSGFFPHSNVAGSYLIVCGMVGMGVALSRWKRARDGVGRLLAGGCALTVPWILGAAFLTKSLGALLSGAAGMLLWIILTWRRRWIERHCDKAWIFGWLLVLVGLAAVVGHGLYHGSLPGQSLDFRWKYWRAATAMIADHPLTGVGRENFGSHYLRYKAIEASEEVTTPHNLFVQAAADWGIPGLVGILIMMLGASRVLSRPVARQSPLDHRTSIVPTLQQALLSACGLAAVVALLRIPLLGTSDRAFLYYTTVTTGIVWLVSFILFAAVPIAGDSSEAEGFRTIATGTAMGLFAFLLHDMINFASFIPGTETTFFALLAVCLVDRQGVQRVRGKMNAVRRWFPIVAIAGSTALLLWIAFVPVARSTRLMRLARDAARIPTTTPIADHPANVLFLRAADADPLDPTPLLERARWLMAVPENRPVRAEAFRLAADSLDAAIERDPFNVRYPRLQVRLYRRWASYSPEVGHFTAAMSAAIRALKCYPLDPTGIAVLADCQEQAAMAAGSKELLSAAYESYAKALSLDDARPEWERIRRFSEERKSDIRDRMADIRDRLDD